MTSMPLNDRRLLRVQTFGEAVRAVGFNGAVWADIGTARSSLHDSAGAVA